MRIYIREAILLLLCFSFFSVDAQTEGKKLFNQPEPYELPHEGIEPLKTSTENVTARTWEVYSDRDNNPTYTSPDLSSQPFKTLNFLDVFYVIEEKDNFLHIFKKDWSATAPGKKNKSVHEIKPGFDNFDYGWVPKDKLLLWSSSIVNQYKFSIKALPVLKDAGAFRNPEKYIKKGGTVYIYNNPDDGAKTNENAVKMFQFLYVYKYENKKALIGKSPQVGGEAANCILGWIDTSIVQIWHYSICIWPNDDDNAIIERKTNNIKASLFVNKADATSWSGKGATSEPVWNQDPYQEKILADVKRMPILKTDANNIITTGNVTAVLEQNGGKIQNVNDKASLDSRQGALRDHIRTINLVFVVDGSAGFQPYFQSIKLGIQAIATSKDRQSSDYHNHINYSAVVYRSAKDKDCPSGDLSTATMNTFSKNWGDVSDFLDAQSKLAGCNTDNSGSEAMYAGLEKGLRKFADQKDNQNNLIVLIGGPGDNMDKEVEKKLIGMVADYKAGIVAYQLIHGALPSYDAFKTQLSRVIRGGNTIIADNIKKENPAKAQSLNAGNWCVFKDEPIGTDTREFLEYPSLSPLQGAIIYPPIQQSMKQEDLPAVINRIMDTTDRIIDQNLEKFSASLNGVGNKDEIKLNPTLLMYFNALGENGGTTSQDVINKYIEGGYQFFITGYTTPIVDKLKYPIFSFVIFASAEEYEHLDDAYRNLSLNQATSGELRNALFDAMNQIVVTYIGDKRAKEEIKQMSPDDLQKIITGFNSNNKVLKKHFIADYQDPKKVSDDDVKSLAKHFQEVEAKLHKIRDDKNYLFKQEDDDYYWLPDRLLSGENENN